MLIRIDISYPHLMHVGERFPAAPATLFQAVVAANGHRLDSVSDVLEAMEQGTCVRIVQHCESKPIHFRQAVPRLPKISEIKQKCTEPGSREPLLKPLTMFPLDPAPVHLSYYLQLPRSFNQQRLSDVLRVNILGWGESVTMSKVSIIGTLPVVESGKVFEPADYGTALHVPYEGFLQNLRMLHDARQSSFAAPKRAAKFMEKGSVSPFAAICYDLLDADGDTFSYPQESMSDISAMMRHAMMTALEGKCDRAYVAGHTDIHPFYIPVPTIGHEHADGNIRRLVVAEPSRMGELAKYLYAITSLELRNNGKLKCRAVRRTDNDYVLDQYLQPNRAFRTVTPMVLDRNGGQQRIGKRISALIQKAGYPAPARVTFNKTCWKGKLPVAVRRALVHAEVEFPVPVSGPIMAGLGSGYGIGLFCAN